ncbi:hypothetical protein PPACK8108_LOCUS3522 [Phakopsora pachyrhizi]|uniref:Uncharacterized protein n=1 Tax=Phakopsora pachyrhizi TaxID=170000 RepID=A0AAV0AP02_PHAPC|nr:hypothetical protein PPACK8108_LOCUS3522 [Phakopsora pachyrhizi]
MAIQKKDPQQKQDSCSGWSWPGSSKSILGLFLARARYRMGLAGLVLAGLATNWGWLGWSWHFCQINFQINFGIDLGKVGVKGQLFDGLS